MDESDFTRLAVHRWTTRTRHGMVYAARIVRDVRGGYIATVLMHREILGLGSGRSVLVDHVDRDGLNNVRANLRTATASLNGANAKKRSSSRNRFKGVERAKGRFRARIRVNGKRLNLGYFATEEAAARAYDAAARQHFGAFARTNFGLT